MPLVVVVVAVVVVAVVIVLLCCVRVSHVVRQFKYNTLTTNTLKVYIFSQYIYNYSM